MLLVVGAPAIFLLQRPDLGRARDLSLEIQDANGETLNAALSHDGMWRLRTAPEDVSPAYLRMLLQTEDKRFYRHPGIDPLAMLRAAGQVLTHGRIVSGGSTLTMQVARLLHPHAHTLLGKLADMRTALALEIRYSKRQILTLYLTLAPFGGNVEGVRAASLLYFGHGPAILTAQEAALLVALPQSPTRRRPDRHPAAAVAAIHRILALTHAPQADWRPNPRHPLPHLAACLLDRLRRQTLAGPLRTTLEAPLQRSAEALAARDQAAAASGVGMAALIVRNADRAVLAYVGGSNRAGPAGEIDMVRAIRSPGSALKPFIYAMAMDDGLIRPDTLIDDARLRIADYAPQDFDRAFHGTVPAAEALQQSYNLPAVTLLDWLGASRFAAALRGAGAHIAIPSGGPATLPLALGGVGMTLWDLTTLYAGIGTDGTVRKLRLLQTDPAGAGRALVSQAAARAVTAILRQAPPPAGIAPSQARPIAYKTGTSFGFRDAWAFGTTPAHTIGVWVGRADGTPRPGAFAREAAAPSLFRLFDLLPEEPAGDAAAGSSPAFPRAPALHHLTARGPDSLQGRPPSIIYPPARTTLDLPPGRRLTLEAAGGTPPYRWAVNGTPLPAPPADGASSWQPDGPGFVHLTLTDRNDRSVQEDVVLAAPP